MINAGKYRHKISICNATWSEYNAGFQVLTPQQPPVLTPYASVKTTKGMTVIKNNTDFEKAFTNFTIRYPHTQITRDMVVLFKGKIYTIEYLNDVNEENVELEIQAKEVTH